MPRKKNTSLGSTAPAQKQDMSVALGSSGHDKIPAAPDGPKRPPRIRMNAGMNLHVPENILDKDNYAYRWFAESSIKGGRIEIAKGAYWEHVADSKGQNYKRPSAVDIMYLMKLELEYWLADQEAKRHQVRLTMQKEISIADDEYAPTIDGHPEGGTVSVRRT